MAYENQIKCAGCGISIPFVAEDADPAALLCDSCYGAGNLTIYSLDNQRTPGPMSLSTYDEFGGYDCLFGALQLGMFKLSGYDYGQKSCHPISMAAYSRMRADAMFASHAINNFIPMLKVLKDEHDAWVLLAEELGHAHQPCVCPVCKQIATMERVTT